MTDEPNTDGTLELPETRAKADSAAAGTTIGPYKLLQPIGEGGMGSVWMAEQEQPVRRRVALKLIKGGSNNKEILARFEAERQALAMMDHQNIAKVLDAGTTEDGSPYFVMELVKGIPITKYCDDNKLDINQRLKLFVPVCKAIQHAHQKGIIHRDLKPSNVLVTLYDGQPVPKVIDFGLAKALEHTTKLTDRTMFTEFGKVVGTVQYMSPEQAEMNQLDVDTRTDVYSLGVMLYELLTGSTPLDRETIKRQALLKVLEIIREQEPPRPSTRLSSTGDAISGISQQRQITPARLQQILKGELDWLVMKALDKDRSRRYESASSFADDIERYLSDEPVLARPPSTGYRVQKFVRKHRGLVASVSVMLLLLLAGLASTSWYSYVADVLSEEMSELAYRANKSAKEESRLRKLADAAARTAEEKTLEAERSLKFAEESAKRSQDVLKIVTDSFRRLNPYAEGNVTAKEVLLNAQQALDSSELDEEAKVDLLLTLGISFVGVGDFNSAVSVWEKVVPHQTEKLGADHPETLRVMGNLAVSYRGAGRLEEALELAEKVLKLRIEKLGADHFDTLRAMGNLANSYSMAGRLEEAIKLQAKILKLRTEKLGADHPETTGAMGNLANSYSMAGRLEEAIELQERVLELSTEKRGADHPEALKAMNNLANSYSMAERLKEALELQERVLKLSIEKLRADHPGTLAAMTNLALSYADAGRQQEALELQEKVLELNTQKRGADHPETLRAMNNLAVSYRSTGRLEEALDLAEKVLSRSTAQLGADHPETLRAMGNLAVSYSLAGRLEEALDLSEQRVELSPSNLSYQLSLVAALGKLSEKQIKALNFSNAHDLLKRAITIQKRVLQVDPGNKTIRKYSGLLYTTLAEVGKGLDDPALIAEAEKGLAELESGSKDQ